MFFRSNMKKQTERHGYFYGRVEMSSNVRSFLSQSINYLYSTTMAYKTSRTPYDRESALYTHLPTIITPIRFSPVNVSLSWATS